MPNIGRAIREEITRLSRREIRRHTSGMRKGAAQLRRAIAALKRQARALGSEVARLERKVAGSGVPEVGKAEAGNVRFSARSVLARRKRLGISAADYGKLVGVTGHTIYKWEHGTARPRKAQIVALASVRRLGKREAAARLEEMRRQAAKGRARRKSR